MANTMINFKQEDAETKILLDQRNIGGDHKNTAR